MALVLRAVFGDVAGLRKLLQLFPGDESLTGIVFGQAFELEVIGDFPGRGLTAEFKHTVQVGKFPADRSIGRFLVLSPLDEEASNATISRELSYLNRMLELGRQTTSRKVTNHFKFKRLTEDNPRQGFITREQLQKFTEACHISENSSKDQRHYAALSILGYHLGWRSKELRDLKVRQVEPEAESIRLYRSQSKNKAGRLMKLPAECWEIVVRYIQGKNPDDYPITRSNGFRIRNMKDGWRDVANRAGLPGMIFHDLRRTAARNRLRTGVSASVIMEILGWKPL